jgi:hypothetical protein
MGYTSMGFTFMGHTSIKLKEIQIIGWTKRELQI